MLSKANGCRGSYFIVKYLNYCVGVGAFTYKLENVIISLKAHIIIYYFGL